MIRYLLILLLCFAMVRGASTTETVGASDDDCQYRQGAALAKTGISLTLGKTSGGLTYNNNIRFQTVTIPAGSTIDTVILNLVAATGTSTTSVNVRATCYDTSDAVAIPDSTSFKAKARTTAHVDWTIPTVTGDVTYRFGGSTGNLKTLVQEVVDLAGWASGNDLAFFIDDNGTTPNNRTRQFYSYDNGSNAPSVTIYYTTPAGVQNVYHGVAGVGVRHSIAGNSVLHKK